MTSMVGPWASDAQGGPSSSTITSQIPPTTTATNADPLDFSDIFSFSSLPHPYNPTHMQTDDDAQPRTEEMPPASPEAPDANDMLNMREKLAAMGLVDAPTEEYATTREGDLTARERILTNMVLRLTKPAPQPNSSQLIEQANTIAQLTCQLELLARQHQDERELWQADRESWVRIAGALTARRIAEGTHHANAIEHENATLTSDNRMLKERLVEQQTRLEALEAELRMLRPLLLLQPNTSLNRNDSLSLPPNRGAGRPRKQKEKESSRFSDDELGLHRSTRGHNPMKFSTTSDARSEHLLLATRRIGRQRLAEILPSTAFPILPNPFLHVPPLRAAPLPPAPIPPTSQNNLPPARPTKPPPRRVRAATPDAPESSRRPASSPSGLHLNATQISPLRTTRPHATKVSPVTPTIGGSSRVPSDATPLDHLINASRILDASPSSIDGSPLRRRRPYQEDPESPTQGGRSRVTSGSGARALSPVPPLAPALVAGSSRMMSALDVLAEQAAVVNARSPSRAFSQGSRSDIESEDGDPSEITPRQRPRRGDGMEGVQTTGKRLETPAIMQVAPKIKPSSTRFPNGSGAAGNLAGDQDRRVRATSPFNGD
ncbi:hypothetical protein FRB94_007978 [Tulasnella sp. JGI-2019a]|nr:hypothetical protein FRB94_007978 [Tulasnella sp. JGI-2019a]KAG9027557.1 hypothetical protein FRB95_007624 [Tulasnella sp. JGI-2019a]